MTTQAPTRPTRSPLANTQGGYTPDGRWNDWFVAVLQTNTLRDLRHALLGTAYLLGSEGDTDTKALLVLVDSKLTLDRANAELRAFSSITLSSLSNRIFVALFDANHHALAHSHAALPELGPDFNRWLLTLVNKQLRPARGGSVSQDAVFAHLARCWLQALGPQTTASIQEATGASYPTAANAIKQLEAKELVERSSDRRVMLRYIPQEEWQRWLVSTINTRKVVTYLAPPPPGRSTESMARRVMRLERRDVAIGGIIGARHYLPSLDLAGDIRLDITVHNSTDLGFMRRVDAGLDPTELPAPRPAVAVHFSSGPSQPFVRQGDTVWADPLECLIDLFEMRLYAQVNEFLKFLTASRGDLSLWSPGA